MKKKFYLPTAGFQIKVKRKKNLLKLLNSVVERKKVAEKNLKPAVERK